MTMLLIVATSCSTPGEKAIHQHFDSIGTFDKVEIRDLVKQDTISLTKDSLYRLITDSSILNMRLVSDSSRLQTYVDGNKSWPTIWTREEIQNIQNEIITQNSELDVINNKIKIFESKIGTDKEVFKDVFVYNVQFTLPNKNRFNGEIKVSNIRGEDRWVVETNKVNLLDVLQKMN